MRIITIQKNDAGQRLDKFLTKAVKGLPQSLMYKFIRTKKIKVNRARCEQSQILQEGDEIQLFIKDEFFDAASKDTGALTAIKPKLDIVHEDEHIMLLNKRPGVLVHDDAEGGENTLIMHIQAYLCGKGEYDPESEQSFAPALCNRIDRNTGGMVIAAKDAAALRDMNRVIREDQLSKYYLCLVHGKMERDRATLRGYLRKDSGKNMVEVRDREFPVPRRSSPSTASWGSAARAGRPCPCWRWSWLREGPIRSAPTCPTSAIPWWVTGSTA